jgi:hypothetical protein
MKPYVGRNFCPELLFHVSGGVCLSYLIWERKANIDFVMPSAATHGGEDRNNHIKAARFPYFPDADMTAINAQMITDHVFDISLVGQ